VRDFVVGFGVLVGAEVSVGIGVCEGSIVDVWDEVGKGAISCSSGVSMFQQLVVETNKKDARMIRE
jgi:hypothetical protein